MTSQYIGVVLQLYDFQVNAMISPLNTGYTVIYIEQDWIWIYGNRTNLKISRLKAVIVDNITNKKNTKHNSSKPQMS
jgi:hypothetical protein